MQVSPRTLARIKDLNPGLYVEKQRQDWGSTPLLLCNKHNLRPFIELFNPNLGARDYRRNSIMHEIWRMDPHSILALMELLIILDGIDWNSVNDDGDTPLLRQSHHFEKLLKLLIQSNKNTWCQY